MLSLYTQRCNGCYFIPLLKSDLSIKIHGVVSLPDATSYYIASYTFKRYFTFILEYYCCFLVAPIVLCGFSGDGGEFLYFCFCALFSVVSKFDSISRRKRDLVAILQLPLLLCDYLYSVSFPHGSMCWSAICDCLYV